MAITLLWQSGVSGEKTRLRIDLFGQKLMLAVVGDVIVDSTWLLESDQSLQKDFEWEKRIRSGVTDTRGDGFELKLLAKGTSYNRAVWKALTDIPLGRVSTYSELAENLNSGPRAVAQACRNNPFPGIIPCHRVVAKSGIGGFMGQNRGPWVEFKRQLLNYELDYLHKLA